MNLANWRFESLRLSTFHTQSFDLKGQSPWEFVRSDSPESTTINNEGRQEFKEIEGQLLLCKTLANRVDWFYNSQIPMGRENGGLGDARTALDTFARLTFDWLERSPSEVNRVALGGVAYIPVSGKREGYEVLSQLLPTVQIDVENSRDFQYRINRPREIDLESERITLNRISTWSVRRIEIANLLQPASAPSKVERASCELDINSPSERIGVFTGVQARSLAQQFVEIGVEMLERGDVA